MKEINRFQGEHRFLSNFWPAWVKAADGTEHSTVEQAYQYEKFLGPWPTLKPALEKVKAANTPGRAKREADKYKHLVPQDWHDRKVDVMRRLLTQKFMPGSILGQKLKATGDANLVQGNEWNDQFFGVCNGSGQNWLGRLLMEIRKDL